MSKLTKKGYLIKKKDNNMKLIEDLKNELTVSPKNYYSGIVKQEKVIFNVYQEDDKYLYIPKYYGLQKLGKPKKDKEKIGKSIDLKFKGKLRDYQEPIIKKSIEYMTEKDGGLISLGCGQGKCLGYDTMIVMYDGSLKAVQNIITGDVIMGDDGTLRNILSITTGREKMYQIHQSNGISYTVNSSHILSLKDSSDRIIDIELLSYLNMIPEEKNKLFGFQTSFDYIENNFLSDDFLINTVNSLEHIDNINESILYSSIDSRHQFISFLIIKYGNNITTNFKPKVLQQLMFIFRSVGYKCIIENNIIKFEKKNNMSRLTIEEMGEDNYYGFTIDGNRRFLLEDFTVTHNTVIALYLACHFKVKTLVIVHKTFLLNQWLERIKQFTNASVGIIQQKKVETDNMIVVGMLQSIAKDKYSSKVFKDFGMVIFDEAHHAPSQYFSKALPLINCKKTLALSATPKRMDGLEKVLHWYFGDIIYQSNRINNKDVIVNIIDYTINDKMFKEYKLPFNGKINKPKTITNLVKISKRNELIMEVIKNLYENKHRHILVLSDRIEHLKTIEEMILTFYTHFSYGYYIGGMKQSKLDESAKKRIILASYGMASEALDIPSLNTLVMTTPRSSVEQSVGRIIRKKSKKVKPLIVDIVDNLPSFVRQSKNRLKLYKKKEYYIEKKVYVDNVLKDTIDISDIKISTVKFNPTTVDFV